MKIPSPQKKYYKYSKNTAKKLPLKKQKALALIREIIPIAIESAEKQIVEENHLDSGSNPIGASSNKD